MNLPISRGAPLTVLSAVAALLPHFAHACASCGCTLSSDAAMGYAAEAGWRLSLEQLARRFE